MKIIPSMSSTMFWWTMIFVVGPVLVSVYTILLRVILLIVIYTFSNIPLTFIKISWYVIFGLGIIGAVATILEMWKSSKATPPKSIQ